jgi:hypothetical protein
MPQMTQMTQMPQMPQMTQMAEMCVRERVIDGSRLRGRLRED